MAVAQGGILVRYLSTLLDALHLDYGVSKEALFEAADLPPLYEMAPTDRVSQEYANDLWSHALELADEMLGLRLGQRLQYASLASLGHVLMTCDTLEDALRASCKYTDYVGSGSFLVIEKGETLTVDYQAADEHMPAVECRVEASLLPFCTMADFSGARIAPRYVCLKRKAPQNIAEYEEVFRAPVRFGQAENSICWHRADLAKQMPEANPSLNDILKAHLEKERPQATKISDQIIGEFLEQFKLGEARSYKLADIARELNIAPRSLQRKLKEEGKSFRALFLQARIARAEELLLGSAMPIAQIAASLGYSEPAAFVRSFKAYRGDPPSVFRRKFS